MSASLEIVRADTTFDRWDAVLALIMRAFDGMDGRIDPPSSAHRLTPRSLRQKAADEVALLAFADDSLVGCVFLAERPDHFYLGKLAVDPATQGRGVGTALIAAAEDHARRAGKPVIELETRVELTENHGAFMRLGFVETARNAHAGFTRPTSVTFRKLLDA